MFLCKLYSNINIENSIQIKTEWSAFAYLFPYLQIKLDYAKLVAQLLTEVGTALI